MIEKFSKLVLNYYFISTAFLLYSVFSLIDIFNDIQEGAPNSHVILEGLTVVASVLSIILIVWAIRIKNKEQQKRIQSLNSTLEATNDQLNVWKGKNNKFLKGLSEHIQMQFEYWSLSPAEKDVALLMVKGFTSSEMAKIRGTCEKTIRHQSSSILKKSGLPSRVQLISYFLEDLLPPREI